MKEIQINNADGTRTESTIESEPQTLFWPREFLQRFSNQEIVDIQLSVDPGVIVAKTHLQTANAQIDITLAETHQLMQLLVYGGVITQERSDEIMTAS